MPPEIRADTAEAARRIGDAHRIEHARALRQGGGPAQAAMLHQHFRHLRADASGRD